MQTIKEWLEDQETTENVWEAIFILEDGLMIDGQFDYGMRGLDHNCITSLAPDNFTHPNKWDYIHKTYNVIRMVPETKIALVREQQQISENQMKLINESEYEIEFY